MLARVKSWFARHESGTKFYQVYAISMEGADTCCIVTHWGPYSPGGTTLPSASGQSKVTWVKSSALEWEASRAMNLKKGRGYNFSPNLGEDFSSPEAFESFLKMTFKRPHALEMSVTLCVPSGAVGESDLEYLFSKRPPSSEPEESSRSEEWGSW